MKIQVTDKVTFESLKPGDLFANATQEFYDTVVPAEMAVSVFVRTDAKVEDNPRVKNALVYKVKIVKGRAKATKKTEKPAE